MHGVWDQATAVEPKGSREESSEAAKPAAQERASPGQISTTEGGSHQSRRAEAEIRLEAGGTRKKKPGRAVGQRSAGH